MNILTCVYCGAAYPEGTPPHSSKVLTDHISVCDKHPMREVIKERDEAREAIAKIHNALCDCPPHEYPAYDMAFVSNWILTNIRWIREDLERQYSEEE